MEIIRAIPPPQPKNKWVAIDTEWMGMNGKLLHRPFISNVPNGKFACLTVCTAPRTVYLVENELQVTQALQNVLQCVWVMHNAKFDITHLRRYAHIPPRKRLWDTMLIEQILYSGYYERFDLKNCVRRHLDIKLDKEARDLFENTTEMTDEMRTYAANDAHYTLLVALAQKELVTVSDMKIYHEVDRPALFAFMDFMGFRMDVDAWKTLAETNKQRAREIDETLSINPRSPKQVLDVLKKTGFRGLKDTNEATLTKYIINHPDKEAANVAKKVLESRKYAKRSSTYGIKFIEDYLETESEDVKIVFGDYKVVGAETGRTACGSPNLMNIITRDTKEYRKCFIARPFHKLVVLDYSQQEPLCSAYLSQDKKLIAASKGADVYIETAKIRYKEMIEKSDPRRQHMKSIFLGLGYGMSAYGLAEREGIPVDEAEKEIQEFFKVFSGLKKWMDHQVKEKRLVRTIWGRKIWLNPYNGQCERNALNGPMQGSAADMTKASIGRIHRDWKFDCPFGMIAQIHDEIILDVPESLAKEVSKYCAKIMIDAAEEMCKGITFRVGISIGDNWSEK